jgi:hypothetical protein
MVMYPVKPDHPAVVETHYRLNGLAHEAEQRRLIRQTQTPRGASLRRYAALMLASLSAAFHRSRQEIAPRPQPAQPVLKKSPLQP